MDFVSLSPSDDDLFRRDQDYHSPEADNFRFTSLPETPISVTQKTPRKRVSSKNTNSVSSMVRIPPGLSLLNIQDYHSLPEESSVSPSPPPSAAKRGRGNSGVVVTAVRRLLRLRDAKPPTIVPPTPAEQLAGCSVTTLR